MNLLNKEKIEKIKRKKNMIKNFIYLDEYKMYSLSSQIFEGITEYLVSKDYKEEQNNDTQKGTVGSGRLLADIIKDGSQTEEKKYLHDYSYTLFEKYLIDNSKVADINSLNCEDDIVDIAANTSFIKIKGKATFNDIESLMRTLKDFNKIGKAFAYMQMINDKSSKYNNLNDYAKHNGLQQDQKLLDNLNVLLEYGFNEQLEVQINHNKKLFSTNIKREYLREKEDLLVKRYSRETEKEFVIFGIVTQCQDKVDKNTDENKVLDNPKEAIMNMVEIISKLESGFTGKLQHEIIIDPIAIYTEL
jgi:hypothetical protein